MLALLCENVFGLALFVLVAIVALEYQDFLGTKVVVIILFLGALWLLYGFLKAFFVGVYETIVSFLKVAFVLFILSSIVVGMLLLTGHLELQSLKGPLQVMHTTLMLGLKLFSKGVSAAQWSLALLSTALQESDASVEVLDNLVT